MLELYAVCVGVGLASISGRGPLASLRPDLGLVGIAASARTFVAVAGITAISFMVALNYLRQALQRNREHEVQLSQLLDSASGTAFIATDLSGLITWFSPGVEQLTGHRAQDLVGRCDPLVFHSARGRRACRPPGCRHELRGAHAGRATGCAAGDPRLDPPAPGRPSADCVRQRHPGPRRLGSDPGTSATSPTSGQPARLWCRRWTRSARPRAGSRSSTAPRTTSSLGRLLNLVEDLLALAQVVDGTGLGLSIVRSIADAHGGRVAVTSRPGQGTTFVVHVPLVVDSAHRTPAAATTPQR